MPQITGEPPECHQPRYRAADCSGHPGHTSEGNDASAIQALTHQLPATPYPSLSHRDRLGGKSQLKDRLYT